MVNKIISGISNALYNEFGEGYEIYTQQIEQGLQQPCFLIASLSPSYSLFRDKRYRFQDTIAVQYFPLQVGDYIELNQILYRLFSCLEYITVDGDLIRGANMQGEQTDNILTFKIDFDLFLYDFTKETGMEELEQKTNIME
ncbi:phage tail terminator family protein [Massilioclostridium coli]|uniref:phage tail terminator family protein n=1 Tax=Massilioclostridium coli TaxID=1870991 RepID=UPI0022E405F2|nr:hypothetical protein [Massilioclostridium coli]